jgi:hypothetical protein
MDHRVKPGDDAEGVSLFVPPTRSHASSPPRCLVGAGGAGSPCRPFPPSFFSRIGQAQSAKQTRARGTPGVSHTRGPVWMKKQTTRDQSPRSADGTGVPRAMWRDLLRGPRWTLLHRVPAPAPAGRDLGPVRSALTSRARAGHRTAGRLCRLRPSHPASGDAGLTPLVIGAGCIGI